MLAGARTRVFSDGTSCEQHTHYWVRLRERATERATCSRERAPDGTADRLAPAIVVDRVDFQPEVGEHGRAVEVAGDLLGPPPRRDVLGAMQRRAALARRQAQEIRGDQRDRAPGALLPRRVGGGVDDDLAHDAPAGVMGLAARDEEVRERVREDLGVGLGAVGVEVAKGRADVAAVLDRAGELTRAAARAPPGIGAGQRRRRSGVVRIK